MPKTSSKFKIRYFLSSSVISLPAYFAKATTSPFFTPSHSVPTSTILPADGFSFEALSGMIMPEAVVLTSSSRETNTRFPSG